MMEPKLDNVNFKTFEISPDMKEKIDKSIMEWRLAIEKAQAAFFRFRPVEDIEYEDVTHKRIER